MKSIIAAVLLMSPTLSQAAMIQADCYEFNGSAARKLFNVNLRSYGDKTAYLTFDIEGSKKEYLLRTSAAEGLAILSLIQADGNANKLVLSLGSLSGNGGNTDKCSTASYSIKLQ